MTSVEHRGVVVPGRVLLGAWVTPTIVATLVAAQPGADDVAVALTLGIVALVTAAVGLVVAARIGIPMRRSVIGRPFDVWFWAALAWACAWGPLSAVSLGLTMTLVGVDSPFLLVVVFAGIGLGCQVLALLGFARHRSLSARAVA